MWEKNMKIEEIVLRDCCNKEKDLIPYNGIVRIRSNARNVRFCKYCGQIWFDAVGTDSHGNEEHGLDVLRLEI
jgi:hypothetical protein